MATKRKYVPIAYEEKKSEKSVCAQVASLVTVPEHGDNCVIAQCVIPKGTPIYVDGVTLIPDYDILEGHRVALYALKPGQPLTSWGLMFGICSRDIQPGNYVCNERMLSALALRGLTDLPTTPNFVDKILPHIIDETKFVPSEQIPLLDQIDTFQGFLRQGSRGVGTRNFVVVVGTTSHTSSYARELCKRMQSLLPTFPNIDGIVPVAHTECGGSELPNNYDLLLRVLSGFLVHSNVGAALVVDYGNEMLQGKHLVDYMAQQGYALSDTITQFLTLRGSYDEDLKNGEAMVSALLPAVNQFGRTEQPVSFLNVALQCGGSDAFSGVSGNPAAGWAAKELIERGGKAVLAETDELIGAESYVLAKCKDLSVAKKFVEFVERFKYRMACHGQSAEANPSGGNNFRGIYNISLKSLGAAKKKNAEVSLDAVVDYGEKITERERGYYFMDSPGNDLESIAGQVATGCNFIYFITGNGSITNFPFVPTIKIITTTRRYELLQKEMDFNAGRYQEGTPMKTLGTELYNLTLDAANGALTVGEKAKHSQICIWRNWSQTTLNQAVIDQANNKLLDSTPLTMKPVATPPPRQRLYQGFECRERSFGPERVALLMPTSLCSSQIADMIAEEMNRRLRSNVIQGPIDRFVALPHTEGCGTGYAKTEGDDVYTRTVLGHLTHPNVRLGLLLEHGCEKHHNDFIAQALRDRGVNPEQFGWASVQLDGGIEKVTHKVGEWFAAAAGKLRPDNRQAVALNNLIVGIMCAEVGVEAKVARSWSALVQQLIQLGASVIMPQNCPLLANNFFLDDLMEAHAATPSLAFGQPLTKRGGCFIMESPTSHWVETLGGLCSGGAQVILALTSRSTQGHPMVPVIQIAPFGAHSSPDLDMAMNSGLTEPENAAVILDIVAGFLSMQDPRYLKRVTTNVDFQISRGQFGCST